MMTYQDLIRQHGPGRIITASRKIVLVARVHVPEVPPGKHQPMALVLGENASPRMIQAAESGEGLLSFPFTLCHSGANSNNQFFVEDELADPDVYESPIGQPVNQDHDQGFKDIVGEVIASRFIAATGMLRASIKCGGVIFAEHYPSVAYKVRRGAGGWAAISMEAMPITLEQVGQYLVIHKPRFIGASLVRFPADVDAKIDPPEAASQRIYPVSSQLLKAGVDQLFG